MLKYMFLNYEFVLIEVNKLLVFIDCSFQNFPFISKKKNLITKFTITLKLFDEN